MDGENRVSISLSDEKIRRVCDALKIVEDELGPMLVKINAAERRDLAKMGDKTVAFVTKATEFAELNPTLAPTFIDTSEMRKDIEAVSSLRTITGLIESLADRLNDTMIVAGSEAYASALAFYGSIKLAAKMNRPGAEGILNELKTRFPRGAAYIQSEQVIAQ